MSLEKLVELLPKIGSILVYVTAITGSIYYYKYKHTFLKYFLIILWYAAISENVGYYLKEFTSINNTILYNIYHLINFSFLLLLYKRYIEKKAYKVWITRFLIIYTISFFLNMLKQNYYEEVQTIPFIIGGIFVIICIIFYFSEILNTNKILYVSKNLLFWISIGLLLYLVSKIPTRFINDYWYEIPYFDKIRLSGFILALAMNICFIIGFICSQKDSKY